MAIKMLIFDSVDELKAYENKKDKIEKIKGSVEVLTKPIKKEEVKKIDKTIVEDITSKYRTRWTNKEKIEMHNHLKDCKKNNFDYKDAIKSTSKFLGRTEGSITFFLSKLGIKYSEMKIHTPVFMVVGDGHRWTKGEDDYLISEVKTFCDKKQRIPTKLYNKMSKRLNRKVSSIKARIYSFKEQGQLTKIYPEERRKVMTKKIRSIVRAKKKKSKDDGYMISRKPTVPEKVKILGKVIPQKNIFSNELTLQQADLLKGMIENDINNRGISKIDNQKLSLLLNIDDENQYERFLIDVSRNAGNLKKIFKVSVINIQKDSAGQYLVFS